MKTESYAYRLTEVGRALKTTFNAAVVYFRGDQCPIDTDASVICHPYHHWRVRIAWHHESISLEISHPDGFSFRDEYPLDVNLGEVLGVVSEKIPVGG